MQEEMALSTATSTEEGVVMEERNSLDLDQLPVVPTTLIERENDVLESPSRVCEIAD